MINKQYTIEDILNECNNFLTDKGITKRVGLLEFNKHLQSVVNAFPYKFLQFRRQFYTTAGQFRYRLPEETKAIKYAIREDEYYPLILIFNL